ncbi:hypothetical protein BG005_003419 [Podila minutissima]|nr:hypothetical protein BG005_003419 [Podila minutissima]
MKIDAMVPSQAQPNIYQTSFYPQEYNKPTHHYMTQGMYSNGHGASPYPRPTIHDRRQSLAVGRSINTPPNSDPRSRPDYPVQAMNPALADDLATAVSSIEISQPVAWDQAPPPPMNPHLRGSIDATPHLPPLSEALHRIFPNPSEGSPSLQTQPPQPTLTMVDNVTVLATTAPPSFYQPVTFGEVHPLPYPQELPTNIIRHPSPSHPMMASSPNVGNGVHAGYGRRVTHPFVPSIDTSSGLMMTSLTSPENSGSSPLIGSPFPHGGLVGVNSAPVSMTRSSPLVGYGMDTMTMPHPAHSPQGHAAYPHAIQTHPMSQPHPESAAGQPVAWMTEGGDMDAQNNKQLYSFIPLSGVNTKKRPRRRFDEIERLYVCNWGECEKSYGTLNHLNAHVNMQKHGPKRDPAEFKELRKAWRRHKRAEEEAAKQAAAFHQQQNQNPLQICEPVLTHMHMPVHGMSHHQPHQLPHPHAHPNQHHPHHTQAMQQHPMGF